MFGFIIYIINMISYISSFIFWLLILPIERDFIYLKKNKTKIRNILYNYIYYYDSENLSLPPKNACYLITKTIN